MRDDNPYRAPETGARDQNGAGAADDLAQDLDRRGVSREEIAARLARRGFDAATIGAAIAKLPPRRRARSPLRAWLGGRGPFLVLGGGIVAIGFALAMGNVTGALPTLPYLGTLLIFFGICLLRIAMN